jgi:predicted short-subunit dehydrogenase-like oxidoreductase (DUF2520 family)
VILAGAARHFLLLNEMPCYAAAMPPKPRIAIVGPGRLGKALAMGLRQAGYRLSEIVSRSGSSSRGKARSLAQKARAARITNVGATLTADLVWICVPDREIGRVARQLARNLDWKDKTVFHSSGALSSDELTVLRRRGTAVASVHPLMTFVHGSVPSLEGVPFALEGDDAAVRQARGIVRNLGGKAFSISRDRKSLYHAWGGFSSPLLIALLVTAERVAQAAGVSTADARRKMLPIVRQTLANYASLGPARAFSGPIVRGDAEVVRRHMRVLQKIPEARQVYLALAQAGVRYLPTRNRKGLEKVLKA